MCPTSEGVNSQMNRIMIIGQPGSGKSTLAQVLGMRTGLPVTHVDKIHWQRSWVERSKSETTRLCEQAAAHQQWIIEGGHSTTWPGRVARADLLVCLDRPVMLRIWRVLRRSVVMRGRTRPDMAEGCPERLRSLPEFIGYIWRTREAGRTIMKQLATIAPPACRVVYLRSDDEVSAFMKCF